MEPVSRKSYKNASRMNRKKKKVKVNEAGLIVTNSSIRYRDPIVSLPEIISSPIFQVYRRFICTTAVADTLTIYNCIQQFMIATTTILAYPMIYAVRVKKIRILAPVTTQGTSVTVRLTPVTVDTSTNNFSAVPETFLDTSASIDVPAYIQLIPAIDTPLGSWHFATSIDGNLLAIVAPPGSTMDIFFEYILRSSTGTAGAPTRAIVAGTVGVTYAAAVATNFIPTGVNFI